MLSLEKKIIHWADRNKHWLFALVITVLSVGVRRFGLPMESPDYETFLKPWFDTIQHGGGLSGISEQVGDYNLLYQVIIAVMTYLPLPTLRMYKGISILFDYLLAWAVGRLVYRTNGKDVFRGICAYSAMVLLPSVFINSAFWAQCDSIYCFFLVLWFTDLLEERHIRSFVWLALAFQFKLQAIFVLPFLLYFYIRSEKISLLHFLMIPGMAMLISLLCGRGLFGTFQIYANQTGTWEYLSLNFPNIWYLITDDYDLFKNAAVLLTIGILGLGLYILLWKKVEFHRDNIFKLLIWSFWTCLMFLPGMHDRYGYFLTILLVISTVENPRLIGYAAVVEVLTLISYAWFMWYYAEAGAVPKYLASAVYLTTYLLFSYRSFIQNKAWIPENCRADHRLNEG